MFDKSFSDLYTIGRIFYSVLSVKGSHCKEFGTRLMCSSFLVLVRTWADLLIIIIIILKFVLGMPLCVEDI